jgi:hypothetical protein
VIDAATPQPYLARRRIDTRVFHDLQATVRLDHNAFRKEQGTFGPALIVAVTDDAGAIVGGQRTFLNAAASAKDGHDPARKSLGHVKGYAVRFAAKGGSRATETVLMAEGVEDVMTAMLACGFAHAGYAMAGAGMMHSFPPPPGVKKVILCADADAKAGPEGARRTAAALAKHGIEVCIAWPLDGAKDLNAMIAACDKESLEQGYAKVKQAIDNAEPYIPSKGDDPPDPHKFDIDSFVAACTGDPGFPFEPGPLLQLVKLIRASLADFQRLRTRLKDETKVKLGALDDALEVATRAPPRLTPEERERLKEEERKRREGERARLWESCSTIALSKTLLADMEAVVHRLGVVGEGGAIKAIYSAATSRLVGDDAMRVLRRGVSSSGKNYLIGRVMELTPEEEVIRITGGSSLSLIYYGDGDEDALAHKLLLIAEAAVLAPRNGEDPQFTDMLRSLISEGRLDRIVTLTQGGGLPSAVHVRRNGPIALMLTSARDNIEDELDSGGTGEEA